MEAFNKSESEDDSISSASAKSFTLEIPIENQEGESELQEDSYNIAYPYACINAEVRDKNIKVCLAYHSQQLTSYVTYL